jgi:hypothetical protein
MTHTADSKESCQYQQQQQFAASPQSYGARDQCAVTTTTTGWRITTASGTVPTSPR